MKSRIIGLMLAISGLGALVLTQTAFAAIPNGAYILPITCYDSDRGANIFIKGTTKILQNIFKTVLETKTDSCFNQTTVLENTCLGYTQIAKTNIACGAKSLCQDGACLAVPTLTASRNSNYLDADKLHPNGTAYQQNVKVASFIVSSTLNTTGNGEDVLLSQVTLKDAAANFCIGSYLRNLTLKDVQGNVISSVIAQPLNTCVNRNSYTLNLNQPLPVPARSRVIIDVYADAKAPLYIPTSLIELNAITAKGKTTNSDFSLANINMALQKIYLPVHKELAVTTLAAPVSQAVVIGTNNFTLAKFELNSGASGEDILVTELTITDNMIGDKASYNDIANLQLYDANGLPIKTLNNTATNAHSVKFALVNPLPVSMVAPVVLTLKADVVARSAQNQESHTFYIANADGQVVARGKNSENALSFTEIKITGNGQAMMIVDSGSLVVSLVSGANASPAIDQLVNIGINNLPVFAFKLTVINEAAKLNALKFTVTGASLIQSDVVNLRLYRNAEQNPFATGHWMTCANNICNFTWTANDNLLPEPIQPGFPVTIYVKADIEWKNLARLGDSFKFAIATSTDIEAKGAYTGNLTKVTGAPAAGGTTYIMPFTVKITGNKPDAGSSATQSIMGGFELGNFQIFNYGSSTINITDVKLTNNHFHTGADTTYNLFASNQNSNNYGQDPIATSDSDFINGQYNFHLAQPLTLDMGNYLYIALRIKNLGACQAGDSFSIGIKSLGDVKYSVSEADLGYDGDLDGLRNSVITNLFVDGKPQLGTYIKQ